MTYPSVTPDSPTFRAGAAEVDITPPLGTQIDGDIGRHRPAETVLDPLYAKAIVLADGDARFCVLSLDLLAITDEWTRRVRDMAQQRFGLPHDALAVHVTQNHSAPSLGHIMLTDRLSATKQYPWLRGSDEAYFTIAMEGIESAIREAIDALTPVTIAHGALADGRVAFNRRSVQRDGTAVLGGRRDGVAFIEGPIDPEVAVVSLTDATGVNIAALLHHTCHPVFGYPTREVSADWPGQWCAAAQAACGFSHAMVLNGCCGNIGIRNVLDPDHETSAQRAGERLAQTTQQIVDNLHASAGPRLVWKSRTIRVPFRDVPTAEIAEAHQYIKDHPEPTWVDDTHTRCDRAWCYAASMLDLEALLTSDDAYDYEIQAVRFGDVALLFLTGEPFAEGQLEIKQRSPFPRTIVAHMSNGYVGYIPTLRAFDHGGYETKTWMAAKLVPEALQMIVDASVELLAEVRT